jgi:hypothetical protein
VQNIVLSLTCLVALAAFATVPAHAQQPGVANIMVLADDEDPDSLPASNNIHNRVIFELRKQMSPVYEVLDTSAVLDELDDWTLDDLHSRTQKIAFAKAACKDGDANTCPRFLVFVNTRAFVQSKGFGSVVMARLQGDVIDIYNNNVLGDFQPVAEDFVAPRDCNIFCLDEAIGREAYNIATKLGAVLEAKLNAALRVAPGTASTNSPPAANNWTD